MCVCACSHIKFSPLNLIKHLVLIVVPEWRVAHQQDVQHHPTRPHIHRIRVLLFLYYFWREVPGCTGEPCVCVCVCVCEQVKNHCFNKDTHNYICDRLWEKGPLGSGDQFSVYCPIRKSFFCAFKCTKN